MTFCIMEYRPNFYDEKRAVRFFFDLEKILQKKVKSGIMIRLYSPDKMVEISIFSFESQFANTDGSKVVRHSTVVAIMRLPYAPD